MKKYITAFIVIFSFSITACTNNVVEPERKTTESIKEVLNKTTEAVLPTYGPSDLADGPIYSEQARNEGRLTIKNSCVTLTYPKEYYPTASGNNIVIPIFPGGSQLINDGQAVQVGPNIFQEGDFVEMSGSSTVREFWKSFEPNMEYTLVPDHCAANEYWLAGFVNKMDIGKVGK